MCHCSYTGFLSQLGAKLRDWAVRPVRAGCYSWAELSFIDSKTLYTYISREVNLLPLSFVMFLYPQILNIEQGSVTI